MDPKISFHKLTQIFNLGENGRGIFPETLEIGILVIGIFKQLKHVISYASGAAVRCVLFQIDAEM